MSYFPVDDGFTFHPKAIAAGNEALGMWVRAGAWCKAHVTGGIIPREVARAIGSKRAADRLVAAGLWVETPDAYYFHDWDHQAGNDDAETEKARREKQRARNAERQARHRARNAESNAVSNDPVTATPSPSPSPSPDFFSPSKSQSRSNRASVSTDSIEVSEMTRRLAAQKGIKSLRVVVDSIQRHTGLTVDAAQAYQVCEHLLGKAKTFPDAPQRYVLRCIEQSPLEVQKHIHEAVA